MKDNIFKIIYHTADIGIEVVAGNLEDLFRKSALGLLNLISDTSLIDIKESVNSFVEGSDHEELLVNFLNEIIFLHETREMVFKDVEITHFKPFEIKFILYGEKIDINRHTFKFSVKSCTYHNLKIEKNGDNYSVKIIFDT